MMTQYKNLSRNSSVLTYSIGDDYIVVQFKKRTPDEFTYYLDPA